MSNTICDHNAQAQVTVPGRAIPCLKCGALLEPSPRAGAVASQKATNATYPGQTVANSSYALNK